MKFKVLKGTPLFDKLTKIDKERKRCRAAAFLLAKELGVDQIRNQSQVIAGGISSFCFKNAGEKPEGWKKSYKDTRCEFFPSKLKKNKELLDRIKSLPVVSYDDLNSIIKYDPWKHTTNRISMCPGVIWKDKYILIDVANHTKYKPVPDMIEILESEFQKLSKGKDDK